MLDKLSANHPGFFVISGRSPQDGMRQRRQLGNRRANATMVSRLTAEPGGHWEKSSQRAIFPTGLSYTQAGIFTTELPTKI